MPQVSDFYKMYLPAGHHRQPRNANISMDLAPQAGGDVTNPGVHTPPFFSELPYTMPGGSGMAKLLFWNVTDGTKGKVLPPVSFTQQVGANPLTITGWYFPVSGPGVGGGGSAIIDDAFSAALGQFIDDTFVTVTSDPSLTNNANVVGVVPTTNAVTLEANAAVASTPEPFNRWILNDALMPVGTRTLDVAQGTNGIAIAIYEKTEPLVIRPPHYEIGGTVIGGVAVDGGGYIIVGGKPIPIDPWGPLMLRLATSAIVTAHAKEMEKRIGGEVQKLAAQDALAAIKVAVPALEKKAGGS
jgi:hypothetical protein